MQFPFVIKTSGDPWNKTDVLTVRIRIRNTDIYNKQDTPQLVSTRNPPLSLKPKKGTSSSLTTAILGFPFIYLGSKLFTICDDVIPCC